MRERLDGFAAGVGARMRSRQLHQDRQAGRIVHVGQRVHRFLLDGDVGILQGELLEQRHRGLLGQRLAQGLDGLATHVGLGVAAGQLDQQRHAALVVVVAERLDRLALDVEVGVGAGDGAQRVARRQLGTLAEGFDRFAPRLAIVERAGQRDQRRRRLRHRDLTHRLGRFLTDA